MRWGKATRGSPPRRRSVLIVFPWSVRVLGEWLTYEGVPRPRVAAEQELRPGRPADTIQLQAAHHGLGRTDRVPSFCTGEALRPTQLPQLCAPSLAVATSLLLRGADSVADVGHSCSYCRLFQFLSSGRWVLHVHPALHSHEMAFTIP
jgi:hypothetical protein